MIGRIITLGLCAGAFYLGMQFQTSQTTAACLKAGGSINASLVCIGAKP